MRADGIKAETALVEGSPHDALIDYTKQHGIDAVVISTHGRGGIKRMLIGSVTDKIIRSGETPVLVVPG